MSRFSATVMEHFQNPRNRGRLAEASLVGVEGSPGRGRYFIVYLRLVNELVEQASFECNGCGVTIATGSVLTEYLIKRSLAECRQLTVSALLSEMEGLPADKSYCAVFAIAALQDAVRQALPGHEPTDLA